MTNDAGPAMITDRHFVEAVWRAVRALQPRQRAALLLNVRDGAGASALPLLNRAGLASVADIAALIDIPDAALRRLWNSLPFDDLQIGAYLGITWVQVVQLRQTARAVLVRRISEFGVSLQALLRTAGDSDIAALADLWRSELIAADDQHVPAELLQALVTNRLGEADREAVTGHVEVCARCAAEVSNLRARTAELSTYRPRQSRRAWILSKFRW